jgi:hypothetical protein
MMGAFFALGSPFPQKVREQFTKRLGARGPQLVSAAFHMGLGMLLAIALFVPLIISPDTDYPLRSRYTTVFEALGRSTNAPVVQGMYALVQGAGWAVGGAIIALMIFGTGAALGWLGVLFGRFKDKMYDELGLIKYTIIMSLLMMMMGVMGKILLRLLFGVKYLFSLPSFNFNI